MKIKAKPLSSGDTLQACGMCDCRITDIEPADYVKAGRVKVKFETPAGTASSVFNPEDGRMTRLFRTSGALKQAPEDAVEWDTAWLIGRHVSCVWGYKTRKQEKYPDLVAFGEPAGTLGIKQLPPETWAEYGCDKTGKTEWTPDKDKK